jgi:beta-glucosidase
MQPIITLHHFTHPAWLPFDMWLTHEGPDLLAAYQLGVAEKVNEQIFQDTGQVMRHFLVYNEPNIVPLIYHFSGLFSAEKQGPPFMLEAFDTMLSRYVKVYDGLYDLFGRKGWGTPHVGFTLATMCPYELDKLLFDILRLRSFGVERKDAAAKLREFRAAFNTRINTLAKSKLNDEQYARYLGLVELTGQTLNSEHWTKTLDALYASPRAKKLDYLSINVYEPFNGPKGSEDMTKPPLWWEFAADPEVYRTFIHADNEFNADLPFYLGENSLAYRQPVGKPAGPRPDGWNRERFFKTYLMQVVRCIKEGVPIRGYLYWSLVDDFEWDAGFSPRLGLYNYDYINHRINPADGLGDPAGEIYAHLIAALRSGNKQHLQHAFTNSFKQVKTLVGATS